MLVDGNYVIGYPQVWSRADYCKAEGGPKHAAYTCNLGGDPTMEVWSAEPAPLNIDYEWWANGTMKTLQVTVTTTGGQPVPDANVCLWQHWYYLTNTTGNYGRCTFKDLLFGFNDGKLTATKHNYRPALRNNVTVGE